MQFFAISCDIIAKTHKYIDFSTKLKSKIRGGAEPLHYYPEGIQYGGILTMFGSQIFPVACHESIAFTNRKTMLNGGSLNHYFLKFSHNG